MTNVKLISCTQGAGQLQDKGPQESIRYVAKVSNPHTQSNFDTAAGLLRYCIKHQHWYIFETASMTLEINNNLQEDRSAGCERVGYDGRSFEVTGSLVTKAYISDAKDWQRKYENGTRFNVAVELYWPEDSRKMVIVIEQGVATEHDMPTEANAIASNSMSYAAEESTTTGKTISVYANF